MFTVNRFDPRKEESRARSKLKKQQKKRKLNADHNHDSDSKRDNNASGTNVKTASKERGVLQVIAPETDGAVATQKNLNGKINAEAFDDLGIDNHDENDTLVRKHDELAAASTLSASKLTPSDEINDSDDNNKSQRFEGGDADVDTMPAKDGINRDKESLEGFDFDPTNETERALAMSRLPIAEAAKRWGVADFLIRNLQSNGYEHFFPIQALTIPDTIIAERHMSSLRIRDVCCAAPTGSGKIYLDNNF